MVQLKDYFETNEHKMEHCPFCHKHTLEKWIDDTNRYFVKCANCGAMTAPRFKPQDATNDSKAVGNYIIHGPIQPVPMDEDESSPIPNNTHHASRFAPKEEE